MNMKRFLTSIIVLISIVGVMIVFTGCPKDDTTPPSIYFDQLQDTTVLLYTLFEDPWVLVEDNKDFAEDITVKSDFEDNISLYSSGRLRRTGDYEITYTATDLAGNSSNKIRTIHVKNPAEIVVGSYNVTATYDNQPDTTFRALISADTREAGRIRFSKSYFHLYEGEPTYLKAEGRLYSPVHSPDMTIPTVEPGEHVGWLGIDNDNTDIPFYDTLYYSETMPLMTRYDYIHIPTIYKTDTIAGINHKIVGRKDVNGYPMSKITFNGDIVTKIELYYTVTNTQHPEWGAEKVEEIFIP
ncbi:MAG: immunoglobulin-like domain-containing protein [Bacteroidales bacterium]